MVIASPREKVLETLESSLVSRMQNVGIDFYADEWLLATSDATKSDTPVCLRWPTLNKGLGSDVNSGDTFLIVLKRIAALWHIGSENHTNLFKPKTIQVRVRLMKRFLTDMSRQGNCSLDQLTPKQAQDWVLTTFIFRGGRDPAIRRTVQLAMIVIRELHALLPYVGIGLHLDPFPPKIAKRLLARAKEGGTWIAPPEPVCMILIRESIRLIGIPSDDLIRMAAKYITAFHEGRRRGLRSKRSLRAVTRAALSHESYSVLESENQPWTNAVPDNFDALARLMRHIQAACFIVITYTSGPRVSEVRRACPGSVKQLTHSDGSAHSYYFAPRSKRRRKIKDVDDEGLMEEQPWILSPVAQRALDVLDRLSLALRQRSGISNYWVSYSGRGFWPYKAPRSGFHTLSETRINARLNDLALYIGLEQKTGWTGRLHTHMGRKCLARFIAKRDRRALEDLALQFSHLSAYSVDVGYARPDSEYRRLIYEELADEFELAAKTIAGLGTGQIYHNLKEEEFEQWHMNIVKLAGQLRSKNELKRLLGKGAFILPGLWGGCAYREQTSACKGNADGPNPALRSPLTCKGCLNFRALPVHARWWREYREDSVRFLAISGIPTQTRLLLQQRIGHSDEVLSRIAAKNT